MPSASDPNSPLRSNVVLLPSGKPNVAPARGLADLRTRYGDIQVVAGQIVGPKGWESRNMVLMPGLPGWAHKIYVNTAVVLPAQEALSLCLALKDGYRIESLGCFSPRAKRNNADELSLHSWALAFDLNSDTNPRGRPLRKNIPDAWITAWKKVGWVWGGDFPTPDPMHFQWASGI